MAPAKAENTTILGEHTLSEMKPEKMDVDKIAPEKSPTTQNSPGNFWKWKTKWMKISTKSPTIHINIYPIYTENHETKVPESDSNPVLLPMTASITSQGTSEEHIPPGIKSEYSSIQARRNRVM